MNLNYRLLRYYILVTMGLWQPRSPDLNVCAFLLWGGMSKDR